MFIPGGFRIPRISPQLFLYAAVLWTVLHTSAFAITNLDQDYRIGWDAREPYHFIDRHGHYEVLGGIDIELMRLIAADAGLKMRFVRTGWSDNLGGLQSGELDVALGAFMENQRASYAWFTDSYRSEKQMLFFSRDDHPHFAPSSVAELLQMVEAEQFRLGIVSGFYYGPVLTPALQEKRLARLIVKANAETQLPGLLIDGDADGFIADRLVGVAAVERAGLSTRIQEYPLVLHEAAVHAMISRKNHDVQDVNRFNESLARLKNDGRYQEVVRHHTAPILLSAALSGRWFSILDIIGTIAFAISGVLIARKENYSLLGAFVLASLPAVGGGVVRDLLVGREPIAIMATPMYLYLVISTVLLGYLLNWLLKFVRGRFLFVFDLSVWIVQLSRYVLPRNVFELFDAIGLAAFTITGVAIASQYQADPLLIWGPLLAAFTAAGGGILRDVFRADAHNPALKVSFYAEIAIVWGFLLSLFLYFLSGQVGADSVRLAVVVTVVGAFITRMGVVVARVHSPRF